VLIHKFIVLQLVCEHVHFGQWFVLLLNILKLRLSLLDLRLHLLLIVLLLQFLVESVFVLRDKPAVLLDLLQMPTPFLQLQSQSLLEFLLLPLLLRLPPPLLLKDLDLPVLDLLSHLLLVQLDDLLPSLLPFSFLLVDLPDQVPGLPLLLFLEVKQVTSSVLCCFSRTTGEPSPKNCSMSLLCMSACSSCSQHTYHLGLQGHRLLQLGQVAAHLLLPTGPDRLLEQAAQLTALLSYCFHPVSQSDRHYFVCFQHDFLADLGSE